MKKAEEMDKINHRSNTVKPFSLKLRAMKSKLNQAALQKIINKVQEAQRLRQEAIDAELNACDSSSYLSSRNTDSIIRALFEESVEEQHTFRGSES